MKHNENQYDNRLLIGLAIISVVAISGVGLVSLSNDVETIVETTVETEVEVCNKAYYLCGLDAPFNGQNSTQNNVNVTDIEIDNRLSEVDSDRFTGYDRQQSKILDTINFIKMWQGTHTDSLEFYLD